MVEHTGANPAEVEQAVREITQHFNTDNSGIQVLRHGSTVQLVSSPLHSKLITDYLKEEQTGELTRPAVETLTIVAYRGPISKIHLDTIRGVNCALILRHLMIRGLIEAKAVSDKYQTTYQVTADFVRFLGLSNINQLPDYEALHHDETLEQILNPAAPVTVSEETASQPPT